MDRYDPQAIEAKWQQVWDEAGAFRRRTRTTRRRRTRRSRTWSRCCRIRRATCTWGTCSNYTIGDVVTHIRRRSGLRCCGRWATTRSACRPRTPRSRRAAIRARSPSATSPRSASRCKRMGWAIDWAREISTHEPDVLPLDAVAVPALLRAGPRVPQGGARQVVPERPDRARERAGDRRPLRALRRRGRGAEPRAVVSSGSPTTPTRCSTTWQQLETGRSAS